MVKTDSSSSNNSNSCTISNSTDEYLQSLHKQVCRSNFRRDTQDTYISSVAEWISSQQEVATLQRTSSSTVLNEMTINNYHKYDNNHKHEIKRKEVTFLTRLAISTCIMCPLTGIFSIVFTRKMKQHYYRSEYAQANKYKNLGKFFTYVSMLLGGMCGLACLVALNNLV